MSEQELHAHVAVDHDAGVEHESELDDLVGPVGVHAGLGPRDDPGAPHIGPPVDPLALLAGDAGVGVVDGNVGTRRVDGSGEAVGGGAVPGRGRRGDRDSVEVEVCGPDAIGEDQLRGA